MTSVSPGSSRARAEIVVPQKEGETSIVVEFTVNVVDVSVAPVAREEVEKSVMEGAPPVAEIGGTAIRPTTNSTTPTPTTERHPHRPRFARRKLRDEGPVVVMLLERFTTRTNEESTNGQREPGRDPYARVSVRRAPPCPILSWPIG